MTITQDQLDRINQMRRKAGWKPVTMAVAVELIDSMTAEKQAETMIRIEDGE